MKLLIFCFVLFCTFNIVHNLMCLKYRTTETLSPTVVNCPDPAESDLDEAKCYSLKFEHKGKDHIYKGCLDRYDLVGGMFRHISADPSLTCNKNLCNGSGKVSQKTLIILVTTGFIFVYSQLF